jgi:hypothetical protein
MAGTIISASGKESPRLQKIGIVLATGIEGELGSFQKIDINGNAVVADFFRGVRRSTIEQRIYVGTVK